jgi:glycosyltransferase involved in cell wall biosynthesis
MKILFLGQRGIPTLARQAAREKRVEALALALAAAGHQVTVTCAPPFVARSLRHFNGITLKHIASLNPQRPGGWLHTLLSLRLIWRHQVIHLHGWRMAALSPVAVLLKPLATYIWTVDTFPKRYHRLAGFVARRAAAACDIVTVPTREFQWHLLAGFGIHAQYVPDGYVAEALPHVPVSRFGVKAGQYCITTATSAADVREVAQAYAQTKTRKRLVVLAENKGNLRRLSRKYAFLHFTGAVGRREELSLLGAAAAVIVAGGDTPHELLLQIMHGSGAIIAQTLPRYEEVLGVSALFVKPGDVAGLTEALNDLVLRKERQAHFGARARRRAKAHFAWTRIVPEYLELYHASIAQAVALDSAQPSFAEAPAAR